MKVLWYTNFMCKRGISLNKLFDLLTSPTRTTTAPPPPSPPSQPMKYFLDILVFPHQGKSSLSSLQKSSFKIRVFSAEQRVRGWTLFGCVVRHVHVYLNFCEILRGYLRRDCVLSNVYWLKR